MSTYLWEAWDRAWQRAAGCPRGEGTAGPWDVHCDGAVDQSTNMPEQHHQLIKSPGVVVSAASPPYVLSTSPRHGSTSLTVPSYHRHAHLRKHGHSPSIASRWAARRPNTFLALRCVLATVSSGLNRAEGLRLASERLLVCPSVRVDTSERCAADRSQARRTSVLRVSTRPSLRFG